ncbi:MAG: cyclic nucleotide-binding domain-containing protein [Thermodesulfobacteriota bacterium]|nr:cyclic nucleotide-binding domain-containing protein [Thermodesulfobacteriota bacterium]
MVEDRPIEALQVREYQAGETIVREGASNECFYVILQGEVHISQMDKSIRILSDHDVFGLENYFRGMVYSTTAKAMKASRVATYACDMLEDMVYSKPVLISKVLKSAYLQLEQTTSVAETNIPYSEIINLDVREYSDGDVIIEDGTTGTEIYKLIESEKGLEVLKKGVRIAMINRPGDYFGEMSFILSEPRSATIRSVGKSVVEVIRISEDELEGLIYDNPDVAHKIISGLAKRLRQANMQIVK